jgi:GST-like protein
MWQMGGFGPMLGQAHHFNFYAPEKIPYSMDRYSNEANRLYGVLDRQLADHEYITGTYSIADMATFPWTHTYERQKVDIEAYPHVKRWRQLMNDRPAVKSALSAGKEMREDLAKLNKDEWSKLFGTKTKDK